MTTTSSPYFIRRIGRAASPPTWACYEQIRDEDDDYSDTGSESCSEDDEDYSAGAGEYDLSSDLDRGGDPRANLKEDPDLNMDMDEEGDGVIKTVESKIDSKGKQREIEPNSEKTKVGRERKKPRPPTHTLRPILTIQRSQGFVWNQDLFIPPYIKDRYVASTSPPNSTGFISTSLSSTSSSMTDYEVEVVEIRISEGDLSHIVP